MQKKLITMITIHLMLYKPKLQNSKN